ncbi:MAG: SGNH/GDSL hydrolase family protein [Bacteroidia bacterium]|nr:SGNH/GDSL hydrolase family protein [Bacteroidia bacterium]
MLRTINYEPKKVNPLNAYFESSLYIQDSSKFNQIVKRTNPMHTGYFHDLQFTVPKGNKFRIIALGGSSTYGFGLPNPYYDPYIYNFTQLMAQHCPHITFEAINAGGIGHGSYRVAIINKEIVNYEPDLLLFYIGHNEFWEYPIYQEINYRSPFLYFLSRHFSKWHTYTFLRDLVIDINKATINVPAAFEGEYRIFNQTMYNDVKVKFRQNILAIMKLIKERNIPVIFSTLPANLKVNPEMKTDWLWDASHHLKKLSDTETKAWEMNYKKGVDQIKSGSYRTALVSLNKCKKIDSTYAKLYYYIGKCYEKLGDTTFARINYWKHIDHSRRLIVSEFNEIIREVCLLHQIPFIDTQEKFETLSNNLTDYQLFIDSMHPNANGHKIIANEFFEAFKKTYSIED